MTTDEDAAAAGSDIEDRTAGDPASSTAATAPGALSPRAARGGTLRVVGTVVAIAVVAAAATIVWARLPAGAPPAAAEQEVPSTLSDGRRLPEAPDAVAAAIGLPVVLTERLDPPGDIATGCEMDPRSVVGGHVTPDHATLLARTDNPPMSAEVMADPTTGGPLNVACVSGWNDGAWQRLGLSAVPVRGPESRFPAWMCCDTSGDSIIFHVLNVRPRAAWLLEDKGHYALAYDVAGLDATGVVAGVSPTGVEGSAHVWWVDRDGEIVGETYQGG